jgi:predicted phosphodiesterase
MWVRRAPLVLAALLILLPLSGHARDASGALDLVITPNNGMPAMVTPGGAFDAVLREKGELQLSRDGKSLPLTAEWTALPGGAFRAHCTVPAETAAGAWSIECTAGGKTDTTVRAVYVFAAFPEYYIIAHLSDVHIGFDKKPADDIFRKTIAAVNDSDAAFAVITGDLTHGGTPDQFRTLLEVMDTCNLPTFVTTGNHDRDGRNYENFFGPLTYRFTFGRDGYLAFDTKDFTVADSLGPQDGLLGAYRRELKPCRWVIGLTHRYEPTMGMRAQLTLFVDDPLDLLLFGHIHRELKPEEGEVMPWGTTPMLAVPAERDGKYRLIDITAQGPRPRPVSEVK